jgi:hypothetical protein
MCLQLLNAADFSIQYFPGYKVVTNTQATPAFASVLYPCGTEPPDEASVRANSIANDTGLGFFEIPLTAVSTGDSTAGWALVRHFTCVTAKMQLHYAPA